MTAGYGIDKKIEKPLSNGKKTIIFACLAVLVFYVVMMGWIYNNNTRLSDVLPAFQEALDSRDYGRALGMYRDIHARIVRVSPDDPDSVEKERQILVEMESIVDERVRIIEERIRYQRYTPGVDDRAFLEQMKEMTGASMTLWLSDLAEEFLLGTIEKPTLQFIFDQIGDYSNVESFATPLRKEIDSIEIARGDVQEAEGFFSRGDYIPAASKYEYILGASEGFVHTYVTERLSELKTVMYEPIMEQCDHHLENYRYYTAEEILSDMARIFPDDQKVAAKLLEATSNTSLVESYFGQIEVICVKPLIADSELAFSISAGSSTESFYLTTKEFDRILASLYERDYVLVDAHSMVDMTNESFLLDKTMWVPKGKKPLIIVIENINYSAYLYGKGFCSKLVFNNQGQVCGEYMSAAGQRVVSRSAEAIGILDAFVEAHPDFSFNGTKGIISISGYETVFGYITNVDQLDDRNNALSAMGLPEENPDEETIEKNRLRVMEIISKLKDTGWMFASSTYGFINADESSMEVIRSDTEKWMNQVSTLTGSVDMLVYPNGNFIKGSDPRCVYLKNLGFRIFFGVGTYPYYTFGDNYLYFDRAMMNGDTLRNNNYSRLFDVSEVYDETRQKKLNR
ncbi:MAG: CHAD domain-containing protein [Clostridiales bacterium]|nr:CHAD domain-containing protein [Clostridiales bacterium]